MAIAFRGPVESWQLELDLIREMALSAGDEERLREVGEAQQEIDLLDRPTVNVFHTLLK